MFCLVAEKDIVAHYFDDGTTDYTAKTREELKMGLDHIDTIATKTQEVCGVQR